MIPTLDKYHRILIAPLHWGLGHATRCIPIINHFIELGKEVAFAGDSSSFALLQRRYPNLPSFKLPSYNVRYSHNMTLSILLQAPTLMNAYRKELKATQDIVNEWKPQLIISDNRFGVRHHDVHNIYLTHQLNIQHKNPNIARIANYLHRSFLSKFDECWIPDDTDQSLSGTLSDNDKITIPTTYIGALTRLHLSLSDPNIVLLIILSGPEPSRTELEKKIVHNPRFQSGTIHLVRGTSNKRLDTYPDNFVIHDIVDEKHLTKLINQSSSILSRSGYSTIMDLQNYPRPKYYIPTKGQTEQEYLANYHHHSNGAIHIQSLDTIILTP